MKMGILGEFGDIYSQHKYQTETPLNKLLKEQTDQQKNIVVAVVGKMVPVSVVEEPELSLNRRSQVGLSQTTK